MREDPGARPGRARRPKTEHPCVAVMAFAQTRREPSTRALLRARGLEAAARAARCQASFVASPAQTRSQSAGSAASPSRPVAAGRSAAEGAPAPSASLIASCASPSKSLAARPAYRAPAASRKYSATRSSPAPTQTTPPERGELVEPGRLVAGAPARGQVALPELARPGARALKRNERLPGGPRAGRRPATPAERPSAPWSTGSTPCATARGWRAAAGAARRSRTIRAPCLPAAARRGRGRGREDLLGPQGVEREAARDLRGRERTRPRAKRRRISRRGSLRRRGRHRGGPRAASRRARRGSGCVLGRVQCSLRPGARERLAARPGA